MDFTTLDSARELNAFGLTILGHIAASVDSQKPSNPTISPLSLFSCISSVAVAATPSTANQQQLEQHFTISNLEKVHSYVNGLQSSPQVNGANSIWLKPEFVIKAEFQNFLQKVEIESFPLTKAEPINQWVAARTNNKITQLLTSEIDPLDRLMLVNVVYFKASWLAAFDPKLSMPGDFHGPTKSTVQYMNREAKYDYAESNKDFQVARLPYSDCGLEAVVILPAPGIQISNVLSTVRDLENVLSSTVSTKMHLGLPKFNIKFKADGLIPILKQMGIKDAFDANIDGKFSNLSDEKTIYVSAIEHQVAIEVNEAGTEAAAATAVKMKARCAPQPVPEMLCDRPFLFIVRDVKQRYILFISIITDPSAAAK